MAVWWSATSIIYFLNNMSSLMIIPIITAATVPVPAKIPVKPLSVQANKGQR